MLPPGIKHLQVLKKACHRACFLKLQYGNLHQVSGKSIQMDSFGAAFVVSLREQRISGCFLGLFHVKLVRNGGWGFCFCGSKMELVDGFMILIR